MSADVYPRVHRGELWQLQTPISAANRVVLTVSDTSIDQHRNKVLTCDIVSNNPAGSRLTVKLHEDDPVPGWVAVPEIASTFKGYLGERLGEVHPETILQVDVILQAVFGIG